jgi:hypothetical protein
MHVTRVSTSRVSTSHAASCHTALALRTTERSANVEIRGSNMIERRNGRHAQRSTGAPAQAAPADPAPHAWRREISPPRPATVAAGERQRYLVTLDWASLV